MNSETSGDASEAQPCWMDGFPIPHAAVQRFTMPVVRRAVAVIQSVYGSDLRAHGGVKDRLGLLNFVSRSLHRCEQA